LLLSELLRNKEIDCGVVSVFFISVQKYFVSWAETVFKVLKSNGAVSYTLPSSFEAA
jgi:hypothetical protein